MRALFNRSGLTSRHAWKISRRSGAVCLIALVPALFIPRLLEVKGPETRIWKTLQNMKALKVALDSYRLDHGDYPIDADGLEVLAIRHDGWGDPYVYRRQSGNPGYTLYSVGVNRIDENGGGDDVVGDSKNYCRPYGLGCPIDRVIHLSLVGVLAFGVCGLIGFVSFGMLALYGRIHGARA